MVFVVSLYQGGDPNLDQIMLQSLCRLRHDKIFANCRIYIFSMLKDVNGRCHSYMYKTVSVLTVALYDATETVPANILAGCLYPIKTEIVTPIHNKKDFVSFLIHLLFFILQSFISLYFHFETSCKGNTPIHSISNTQYLKPYLLLLSPDCLIEYVL